MLHHFIAMSAAVAAIGIGSAAMAQSAMSGDAMHAMHADPMAPTMVCRAAQKGETPSAKMPAGDLVCKKIDMAMVMKAPAMPASTTKADEDAAWQKQLDFLHIPLSAGQDASISH